MTGPEHYKAAEDLATGAAERSPHTGELYWTREERALMLAEAQVHATLALAAATLADRFHLPHADGASATLLVHEDPWREAIS